MKPYQADIPLEPGASSEPATTPLNSLNSSPAASSTGQGTRPMPPAGLPPQRDKWHAKAPPSSLPPSSLAGLPPGAAKQQHHHQGAPGAGQPLTSKPRTAHEFLDFAGEPLPPSVAAALRRISVFWEQYWATHFFVQYDKVGRPHSSWVIHGFDFLQHIGGGPPLLRLTPASAVHSHSASEEDEEIDKLKGASGIRPARRAPS